MTAKTIVSIQGDSASYHDIAAQQFFGSTYQPIFCGSFTQTVEALTDLTTDYALCAIENSLYGSINEVYDLILKHNYSIQGEVYLRIEQCLIGLIDADLEAISAVYSHPVALAQCEDFLNEHLPNAERHEYHDTAASVEMIMKLNNPTFAAIASSNAAALYGAAVLAPSIESNKENYTRFIVLGRPDAAPVHEANKTSIILETNHEPGALYAALGAFAKRSINLTKIRSRPVLGQAWHYIFYVDIETGTASQSCTEALADLKDQGCLIRILGSYKNGLEKQLS